MVFFRITVRLLLCNEMAITASSTDNVIDDSRNIFNFSKQVLLPQFDAVANFCQM